MSEIDRMSKGPENHFRGRLLVTLIASTIVVSLIMTMLITPALSEGNPPASNIPARIAYSNHASIGINGNAGFTNASGVTWGSGTASDPYVIEGWDVNASIDDGIVIENANAHFIIRDCYVHDGYWYNLGVYLLNCANGTLSKNICSNNYHGINLKSSSDITVSDNTCNSNTHEGIYLVSSSNNKVNNNTCNSSNWDGILLSSSNNNVLTNNTCSSNDAYGIDIEYSSNNTIGGSTCKSNIRDGIDLVNCTNGILNNNNCSNNNFGIYLLSSSNNTLSNNNCSDNRAGIYLQESSNNKVNNNTCSNNYYDGVFLWSSSDITVTNNTCSNDEAGISLLGLSDITMSGNTMIDGGLVIDGWSLSQFNTHSIDTSNTVNGKPVYYYKNRSGITVPAGAGEVILANCTDIIVDGQNLSGGSVGIELAWSFGITATNNNCSSNKWVGNIYLISSNNCTVSNNTCNSNNWDGIFLRSSNNNALTNNTCSSNDDCGIELNTFSNNNGVSRNQLCNNTGYGVYIWSGSNNNRIWNNTFIGNNGAGSAYNSTHTQSYDDGTCNRWNSSGSLHGYGNWWSDWQTQDIVPPFGIADSPYDISGSAGAKDYYPLLSADFYPPVTTASLSGTLGTNGWYWSSVILSLHATDFGRGVNVTFYRVGTSGNWLNYSSTLVFSDEDSSTVQFYSMDNVSNNETVNAITIKIDKTAPILTINQTAGFEANFDHATISWTSSDATSGIDHFEVSIDGGTFASVGLAMSYNFSGLADGVHNVTVKAIDKAGHEYNKSIQFTVDTSLSGVGTSGDLMLYGAIAAIIVVIIVAVTVIMMRKKKLPPTRLDEMKAEPPAPPTA